MISDEQAEKAADWIRDNAGKIARAKGERVWAEEYRKSLKAMLFLNAEGGVADRENQAYAHDHYLHHLNVLRAAVVRDEELRAMKSAAEMKIEVWRSQSANLRGRI